MLLSLLCSLPPALAAPLPLTPPDQRASGPWVAQDEERKTYLLVWLAEDRPRGRGVFAQLFNSQGQAFSPRREIGQAMAVGAGLDRLTGRYLVAMVQTGIIWGQMLDREGRFAGSSFPIAAFWHPRNSLAWRPIVVSDDQGTFLVVWSDDSGKGPTGKDVFYQLVSASEGRPIGKPRPSLAAGTRSEYLGWRSVVFDSTYRRFIVIWQEGDRRGLVLRFVYPDGRTEDQRLLGIRGLMPALALDAASSQLLLVWEDASTRSPRARLFDLNLKPVGPELVLPGRQRGVDLPSAAFDPVTGRFLLTWRNDFDPYFYGQWISRGGKLLGSPFIVADLQGFAQWSFPLPSPSGGFLVFHENYALHGSQPHALVAVTEIHPQQRLKKATIRDHRVQPAHP